MLDAAGIVRLHHEADTRWHQSQTMHPPADDLGSLILAQHRANFDLWHEEDDARSPDASDARIAEVKHAIDRLNQQRNDLVEQIDQLLLTLVGTQNDAAPLHSETPGLIIDRLSILALKIYHTAEEATRASATEAHRERNQQRLAVLEQQRTDLAACLDALWTEVLSGQRRFRLYRQMKMYNDPDLNPVLYSRSH
jgi:cell division protein FtsB